MRDGCSGKRSYLKREAIERAASYDETLRHDVEFNAYHCKKCDAWHVGHRPYYQRMKDSRVVRRVDLEIHGLLVLDPA